MNEPLQPLPRFWLRIVFLILLMIPILMSHRGMYRTMVASSVVLLIIGSFREARVRDERFECRLVILFIPLRMRRWKLQRFVQIETDVEGRVDFGWSLVLGPAVWLIWRVCDWLFPWVGANINCGYGLQRESAFSRGRETVKKTFNETWSCWND